MDPELRKENYLLSTGCIGRGSSVIKIFVVILIYFPRFGMLYQDQSGNPEVRTYVCTSIRFDART
jgi:hypothetical protein